MIKNLPGYISFIFILTTLITIGFFSSAAKNNRVTLIILLAWLILQGFVGFSYFYLVTGNVPPRFMLLALPPLLLIAGMFLTRSGKHFTDSLNPKWLTWLHVVRIPVELVLLWLYLHEQVPRLMTFEGRNFDILAGLSAPFVAYYGYNRQLLSRTVLLAWNFICLALLINIVVNALLSVPFPLQQFGFEQPNVAILYFPFVWLPCLVVPVVFYAHLAVIRQLINSCQEVKMAENDRLL